jgi:glycosyltransferase involved in cell wall biosynthesis
VDDGSDDDTGEKVAAIGDKRFVFVKAGRIGLNGRVKNIGLETSRGEMIAFIDSDDLWNEEKLEKQLEILARYPASFCLTGGYNFKEPGKPLEYFYRQREGHRHGNLFESVFKSEVAVLTPSLMFRRSCLDVTGNFNEHKPFADGDFILQLAKHFNGVVLYEPLLYRRLHESNDSNAHWIKRCQEGLERLREFKKKKILPARLANEAMFKLNIHFGEKYLIRKEHTKAVNRFIKAWQNKPFSIVPLKKTAKAMLLALKK